MVNLRQTSENASRLVAHLDSTNSQIRGLLAQAQNGNGTVGKLLSDSLLYSDIRHLLAQPGFAARGLQGESEEVHQSSDLLAAG